MVLLTNLIIHERNMLDFCLWVEENKADVSGIHDIDRAIGNWRSHKKNGKIEDRLVEINTITIRCPEQAVYCLLRFCGKGQGIKDGDK
jgi:hypothetical protein